MQKVLLPLDGSALAEQSLPYGQLLAGLLGVPLHLLAVVPESEVDGLVAGEVALQSSLGGEDAVGFERTTAAREVLAERARVAISRHVKELQAAGVRADGEVLIGRPEERILDAARASAGSPIVVVPHNYDGNAADPSTSVADHLIEAQVAPVLVVRSATVTITTGGEPIRLRKILVPVDTPDHGKAALSWAIRLAKATDAEILLLHADMMAAHDSSIGVEARQSATEELRILASNVLTRHGVRVMAKVAAGLTDDAILEEASGSHADLIVLGAKPRSWFGRFFGAVGDSVRQSALVPLLIVPGTP